MASITRRSKGWTVRWRDPDGTERRQQTPTKRSAEDLRREIEEAHARGRRWIPTESRETPGLDELMAAYLADLATRRAQATVEQTAIRLDAALRFLRELRPTGKLWPSMLSKRLLQDFYAWTGRPDTARYDKGRGEDTRRTLVRALEKMWTWAGNQDEYDDVVPRVKRLEFGAPPPKSPTRAPTWAECDAMVAQLPRADYRWIATVIRYTGLRVNQAARLQWSDVDLRAGLLTIRGELGKTRGERQGRIVPLPSPLLDELAGRGVREGLLCPMERSQSALRLAIRRAWALAGVDEAKWRQRPAHALRKAYRTELLRAGADGDAVEYLCGRGMSGVRWTYTEADRAYDLRGVVAMVAEIGDAGDVRPLRATGGAG